MKRILVITTISLIICSCSKDEDVLRFHSYEPNKYIDCVECPEEIEVIETVETVEASNSKSYNKATKNQTFIDQASHKALSVCKGSKVPPSIVVAQAILESGYGKSTLTKRTNNIFNHMHHVQGKGITGYTTANDKDKHGRTKQYKFAKYKTLWFSYKSHVELLERKYSKRLPSNGTPSEKWAAALCGCSTSNSVKEANKAKFVYASSCMWNNGKGKSDYATQLLNIIKKYNLDKLDERWTAKA
jgi:flagellum-specific peptidoglycan hydrolase FlgJ